MVIHEFIFYFQGFLFWIKLILLINNNNYHSGLLILFFMWNPLHQQTELGTIIIIILGAFFCSWAFATVIIITYIIPLFSNFHFCLLYVTFVVSKALIHQVSVLWHKFSRLPTQMFVKANATGDDKLQILCLFKAWDPNDDAIQCILQKYYDNFIPQTSRLPN